MFGDFFNSPPSLAFEQTLIADPDGEGVEVLSPVPGLTQNPMFGGGPRLKVSDNFSPIPRHRVYVQNHYFRNLFGTTFDDGSSSGGISRRESVNLTTIGAEFLLPGGNNSVEIRLPLLHAPGTNNTLSDPFYGDIGNQSAKGGTPANLSVIYKSVLREDEDLFVSAGVAVNIPTAEDVRGSIGLLNYDVENGTTNVIPFLAALFRVHQGLFFQIHTQVDVPLGGDDFNFSETDVFSISYPKSGSFGTFEESVLGSIDLQVAQELYAGSDGGCVGNVTGVIEARLTQALSRSRGVKGAAAGLDGFSDTDVLIDYRQKNPRATYLNLTFGIQVNFANDWHLRVGEVVPLVNNNFTAETLVQFEKRL